ncbi:4Fe-4S dicluster domain-containing protein [Pseudoflavonifractor phocaeensis]|uniref:4Fe-4S dicluster domain-containing protein n=1 Tax=Pseudoflavonifractor phocaeensis TaxID=1870988 RepID=UPI002109C235|nr:4Fe-4S dicluster domain-containing protein [Pseudoflavonifractor phocaeensis]MCQ4866031.1 4Fe-4S binding protein [Pseudoflavonifractor phocaeensis]
MKLYLDLDMEKCSACGACAVACMDQNDIDPDSELPFRNVFCVDRRDSAGVESVCASLSCMHCADAPCVPACPSACLAKDAETGFTLYDNQNCIGCHSCAMACPFGVPSFNREGKMEKCDGCSVRLAHGMEPACVRVCPTGALRVCTEEAYRAVHGSRSILRVLQLL